MKSGKRKSGLPTTLTATWRNDMGLYETISDDVHRSAPIPRWRDWSHSGNQIGSHPLCRSLEDLGHVLRRHCHRDGHHGTGIALARLITPKRGGKPGRDAGARSCIVWLEYSLQGETVGNLPGRSEARHERRGCTATHLVSWVSEPPRLGWLARATQSTRRFPTAASRRGPA